MKSAFTETHLGKFNQKKCRWLTASNKEKLSLHFIYADEYAFNKCKTQALFWEYFLQKVEDNPQFFFIAHEKGGSRRKSVIDTAVYGCHRSMRTIYSAKEKDVTRVLVPFKYIPTKKQLKDLKSVQIEDYLIHQANWKEEGEFYNPRYPKDFKKRQGINKVQNRAELEQIIETETGMPVKEINGPIFVLRNEGTRECLLSEVEHKNNNAYVVWKADGLFFRCHSSQCAGMEKLIHKFHKSANSGDKELYFEDYYTQLMPQLRQCITAFEGDPADTRALENWAKVADFLRKTVVYIINGGNAIYFSKTRDKQGQTTYTLLSSIEKSLKVIAFEFLIETESGIEKKRSTALAVFDNMLSHNSLPSYNHIDFIPYLRNPPKLVNTFNTFDGFPHSGHLMAPTPAELLKLDTIFEHMREIICNGNSRLYDFLLGWFGHLIQHPAEKGSNSTALILTGEQGTGKSLFVSQLRHLVGAKHFLAVKALDELTGRFNKRLENKILCQMDRCDRPHERPVLNERYTIPPNAFFDAEKAFGRNVNDDTRNRLDFPAMTEYLECRLSALVNALGDLR